MSRIDHNRNNEGNNRRDKEEYLRILAEQIRCKKARSEVTKEICGHIEEQEVFYLSEGMTKEEAEAEAVKEMGDPVEVGAALDMVHRPRMTWGWVVLIGILYAAGFVILRLLQENFTEVNFITGDYVQWLLMGLAVLAGVCYVDYSQIGYWAREITIALFILILAGLWLFGQQMNGAWQWISIAGISMNVRMLCFLFVPLYGAVVHSYQGQGYRAVGKCILWMLPALFISLKIPSAVTALKLFLIFLLILSFAVYQSWFRISWIRTLVVLWGGTSALAGAVCLKVAVSGATYQWHRLQMFFQGESYYSSTLKKVYEGCRMFGSGDGERTIKNIGGFIEGMDYGFAYIAAYFGIAAAIGIIGFIVCLLIYFLGMSVGQKNRLGSVMGFGCSAAFLVQILFYVLGNAGLLPFGSMYCPFLTYGGTGILVTNILLGILLSIYRYQDVPLETGKKRIRQILQLRRAE